MIFDAHCDIWTHVARKRLEGERDIMRNYHLNKFKESDINGGIFVVWVDPPYDKNPKYRTTQILSKIKEEIKRPMFWLNDIDKEAIVKDARYNKIYNNISFRTYIEDNYIYVSQQKQIKSTGNGNVSEESIIDTVKNENMDIQVKISRSTHDESLKCNIMYDNTVLSVVSNLKLQEFEKLIENITYK